MYIRNIRLNYKIFFKICFMIIIISIFIMCMYGVNKIFGDNVNYNKSDINIKKISRKDVDIISSSNYTNVLKTVHDDLDMYVGRKIKFTGFVYRVNDFSKNQFVLGREMIISNDMQAVVVGFLCDLNGAEKYEDGCWVEVEGEITKGDYHGEIPIIKIEDIKQTEIPNNEYVYPPDKEYIPTVAHLE